MLEEEALSRPPAEPAEREQPRLTTTVYSTKAAHDRKLHLACHSPLDAGVQLLLMVGAATP